MKSMIVALSLTLMALPVSAQTGAMQAPPSPSSAEGGPSPANSMSDGTSNMHSEATSNPNVSGNASTTNTASGQPTTPSPARHVDGPADGFAHTIPTPAR